MTYSSIDLCSNPLVQTIFSILSGDERQLIQKLPTNPNHILDSFACQLALSPEELCKKVAQSRGWPSGDSRKPQQVSLIRALPESGSILINSLGLQVIITANPFAIPESFLTATQLWELCPWSKIAALLSVIDEVPVEKEEIRPAAQKLSEKLSEKPIQAMQESTQVESQEAKPEEAKQAAPKLLILDDDSNFITVISRFLKREGFEADTVSSVAQARAVLHAEGAKYTALVSDVHIMGEEVTADNLPAGAELVREIRHTSFLKHLPVLMLTSDSALNTKMRCLTEGADMLLPKHADPRLILAYVKRFLSRGESLLAKKNMNRAAA